MTIGVKVDNRQITATVRDDNVSVTVGGGVGPQGPAATITVGTVTTGAPDSSASVVNAGTSGAAVLNFAIPAGPSGATGSQGAAATIAVGTVTTGAAGSSASVTNVGTSGAAVLNFTIPAGATGPQGATGPAGTTTWAGITGKPSDFSPSAHAASHGPSGSDPITVSASQVSDFEDAVIAVSPPADWETLTGIPAVLSDGYFAVDEDDFLCLRSLDQSKAIKVETNAGGYGGLSLYTIEFTDGVTSLGEQTTPWLGSVDVADVTGLGDLATQSSIGNITSDGAIGSQAGLVVATGVDGVLTTLSSIKTLHVDDCGVDAFVTDCSLNDVLVSIDQAFSSRPTTTQYATSGVGGVVKIGTGISIDANGVLSVSYGTSSGTACQGNDSRLTDAREWSASTVSQADAEAGTSTTRAAFTPLRVFQAIAAWWAGSAAKTKLDGIATGATANATDAQLRDRSTHTGTQAASTITGLAAVATSGSAGDLGSGTLPAARLPATAVTAASYGSASSVATFTVGADGRLTAAGSTSISISASQVSDFSSAVAAASPEEVVEYATTSAFPATGNSSLLYVATDPSRAYRWTGSQYVEVGPSTWFMASHAHSASDITSGSLPAARIGSHFSSHQTGGSDAIANVVVSPSQLSADQNDYNPGTGDFFRLDATAARNITGIAAGTNGQAILLINVGSFAITLKHESTSSSANNRLTVSWAGDYVMPANGGAAMLVYFTASNRWRVI